MPWTVATFEVANTGGPNYVATLRCGANTWQNRPFTYAPSPLPLGGPVPAAAHAAQLGSELWNALTRDPPLLEAFNVLLANSHLVLRVEYDPLNAAAAVPWELLCKPAPVDYLLIGNRPVEIVRVPVLARPETCKAVARNRGTRVAFLSDPNAIPAIPLDLDQEAQILTRNGFIRAPTLEALAQTVTQRQPFVVHFGGHGRFYAFEPDPGLVASASGRVIVLNPVGFRNFLGSGIANVGLVVLNACDLANGPISLAAQGPSFAATLLGGGVGTVIAMGHQIPDQVALRFTALFYARLVGRPIVDALHAVRCELYKAYPGTNDHPYWALPRLFSQGEAEPWNTSRRLTRIRLHFRIGNAFDFKATFETHSGSRARLGADSPSSADVLGEPDDLLQVLDELLPVPPAWLLDHRFTSASFHYDDGSQETVCDLIEPPVIAAVSAGEASPAASEGTEPRVRVPRVARKRLAFFGATATLTLALALWLSARPRLKPPDDLKPSRAQRAPLGSSTHVPLPLEAYDADIVEASGTSALTPRRVRVHEGKALLKTPDASIAQPNGGLAATGAPSALATATILNCLREKKYGGFRYICQGKGVAPASDPKCYPSASENDPNGDPYKSSINAESKGVLQYTVGDAQCRCAIKREVMEGCQMRAKNAVEDASRYPSLNAHASERDGRKGNYDRPSASSGKECPNELRMTMSAHEHRGAGAFTPTVSVEPVRPDLIYKLVIQGPDSVPHTSPLLNGTGTITLGDAATRGEFRIRAVAERPGGTCRSTSDMQTATRTD